MKFDRKKETAACIFAGIVSAGLFVILLFAVKLNFFIALLIAAAVYVGFSLLFRPSKKNVGKSDGSLELLKRLDAAQRGFRKIEDSMTEISDGSVRAEAKSLHDVSSKIVDYLSAHPERICEAREFIDYYQATAVKLLSRYAELEAAGLHSHEVERQKADSLDALKMLNRAFTQQFEKLMNSDMTDTDKEIQLLKQTIKTEGIE